MLKINKRQRGTKNRMSTVEEKVKEYLISNGINQRFVANLIGISPSNLSAMFDGKRKMKADELIAFCNHYKLSLAFFKNEESTTEGECAYEI